MKPEIFKTEGVGEFGFKENKTEGGVGGRGMLYFSGYFSFIYVINAYTNITQIYKMNYC